MDVTEFDFDLPDGLIAQEPPPVRGRSRLMVVPRHGGAFVHTTFGTLPSYLERGDVLVLNDTRVFPARLLGRRVPSGGNVECLLLQELREPLPHEGELPGADAAEAIWDALMHPGQKLKPGARVVFERDDVRLWGEVLARHFHGRRTIRLWSDQHTSVIDTIDRIGHIPLPPYIKREDRASDRERYQTVYARERGSVAAPTAGLHFTPELLETLGAAGIERVHVTLHVGYGTFKPVRAERVDDHSVDPEVFSVSQSSAEALTRARRERRRIIAVGTTTTRALESIEIDADGAVKPARGATTLFIRPGHRFRLVDGLITNFHLPRSSLLMLVAAFAGHERIMSAYREAVRERYRFYSYGDAMAIL